MCIVAIAGSPSITEAYLHTNTLSMAPNTPTLLNAVSLMLFYVFCLAPILFPLLQHGIALSVCCFTSKKTIL